MRRFYILRKMKRVKWRRRAGLRRFCAEKALLLKQPRSGTEAGEISQQNAGLEGNLGKDETKK